MMTISISIIALICTLANGQNVFDFGDSAENRLVKMCLSGYTPSGHARSDPIINQNCASDHIHTFYGPQNFHPNTTHEEIRDTSPRFSTTPFNENQSLYWHPTIYEVVDDDGTKTYIRSKFTITPYYRWDNSVLPRTEEFPPGFRMIIYSNDPGVQQRKLNGGEFEVVNFIVECCFRTGEEVDCDSWDHLYFPTDNCDYLEILFTLPTCWDGKSLGDDNDHNSHMRYTTNGEINGLCPNGFAYRLPQITLTVWATEGYNGGTYQLSDGSDFFHVDFFNGWQEGKLQEIIDNCEPLGTNEDGYNPPCACNELLTPNEAPSGAVCDSDVRRLIIDEATDNTVHLPRGSCQGAELIPKFWTGLNDELFKCEHDDFPLCESVGNYKYLKKKFCAGRANDSSEKFATFWTIMKDRDKVLNTECKSDVCTQSDCCVEGLPRKCTNTGVNGLTKTGFKQKMCGENWTLRPKKQLKKRACTKKDGEMCKKKDCCKKEK